MIANIPQGYIAVSDSFEAYFEKRFGYRPGNTLNDLATDEYQTVSDEMIELFSSGQLDAFIWHEGGVKCLSKQGWNEFSAQHIFPSRTIESEWRPGCAWEGLRGTTPFVSKAEFEARIAGLQCSFDVRGIADKQKADGIAPAQLPAKSSGSPESIRKSIMACIEFTSRQGISPPTQGEIIKIIKGCDNDISRTKIRRECKDKEIAPLLPMRKGPRGSRNNNRNNEVEEIRRFLSLANLLN